MAKDIPPGLTQAQHEERAAAARAKAMIAAGAAPREAALANGIDAAAIRRWYGRSWERVGQRIRPVDDDETLEMLLWTTEGPLTLHVSGSRERAKVYAHRRASGRLLAGDASPLAALRGARVAGHELETDPQELEILWLVGEVDFLEINSGPW